MNKNTGFTLIEVLIAMLVLAVGLLGLAGLQATSLSNAQSAYNRSQSTQLAYLLADNMRANVAGVAAYTGSAAQIANCLTTVGCTPAQMAQNDLYQWNLAVTTALPGGVGGIAVAVVGGANVYTITISWTDKNNNGVPVSTSFTTSFRLS
jgi:type IV pilus assembly protein PilV